MKTFTTTSQIQQYLTQFRNAGSSTGLVPTMGALHPGHLSLIKQALEENDVVICSIFVNPTQFTDAADLKNYPRPIADDIQKLEEAGCDILFNPGVNEMYADNEQWHLNIGELEHLLEGKFRPGHYQGVTQVVYKLFNIIKPGTAYFGQKDYQQVLVIRKMVELLSLPVKLVMCPIERESDGLAMSSRNIHLTGDDRQHALLLSRALNKAKEEFDRDISLTDITQTVSEWMNQEPSVHLEYFELADGETLRPADQDTNNIVALVAARVGNTRLIDNMIIK